MVGLLRMDAFLILLAAAALLLAISALLLFLVCKGRGCCGDRVYVALSLVVALAAFLVATSDDVRSIVTTWATGLERAGLKAVTGGNMDGDLVYQATDLLRHTPPQWRSPRQVRVLDAEGCARATKAVLAQRERFVHVDHLAGPVSIVAQGGFKKPRCRTSVREHV